MSEQSTPTGTGAVRSDGSGTPGERYRRAMVIAPTQRPAPARRWYHRFAVLETNLRDGSQTITSWHLTRTGAVHHGARLILHCAGDPLIGFYEWRVFRAGHPLVEQVRQGRTLPERYTGC